METYQSFRQLSAHERESVDFVIECRTTDSPYAILAPHGGNIEPGTCTIAGAIAGMDHSFYGFKGIKPAGNRRLHLTSSLFDEPRALEIANRAEVVLTVHGCQGTTPMLFLGGRHQLLAAELLGGLGAADIPAAPAPDRGLQGYHPHNLCNRGRSGRGVQFELSRGLREALFTDLQACPHHQPTPLFFHFIDTVRDVLAQQDS